MTTATSDHPTVTIAVACLTTCIAVASVYLTQPVFAEIAATYGKPISDARLAFSVSSIAYALAFFVFGPLSDHIGVRRMAGWGLMLGAVSVASAAMFDHYTGFLLSCGALGASAAAVPAAMFALMPRIARKDQIGTYFGLIIAASVVGITLGRAAMGLLTAGLGLHGALLTCACVLLVMAATTRALPEDAAQLSRRLGLLHIYTDTARMLMAPDLLRLFATGFLLFFGYLGVVTFLTLRLHEPPFSLSSAGIGSISLLGLGAVVGAPASGRLVGRFGSLAVGLGGIGIVLGAIACLAWSQSVEGVSVGLFLIFLGVFSCQPAVFVRIAQRVDPASRGAASSLYLLTCLGAGSLASAVLGPIWSNGGWAAITTICAATTLLSGVLLSSDAYISQRNVAQSA